MRPFAVLILFCASLVSSQVNLAPRKGDDAKAKHSPASTLPPDAPIMTIKGFCAQPADPAKPCQTIITRAQFEKLVDAIQPTMDEGSKRQLARAYPQFLIMAREAQHRGVEKTDRFEERIDFARLQILSQELTRQIQEQAAQVPDQDIQDFYQKNSRDFETANLERIIVPLQSEKGTVSPDGMREQAQRMRARAAAGEDFGALQKAAYDAAGVSGDTAPSPALRDMRRRSLPPTQSAAFDLKPGEVSPVISDATGHYIYKMDSKGMVPLQDAKKEIWNVLRQQRSRAMIESIQQPFTTDINNAYFGTEHDED